jgi:hypothetical protein
MRVYALLLGLALTAGYGYAAQVAVSSAGARPNGGVGVGARGPDEKPDAIWYGGTLDPVTVEAKGHAPAKTSARKRCSHVNRSVLL